MLTNLYQLKCNYQARKVSGNHIMSNLPASVIFRLDFGTVSEAREFFFHLIFA